VRGARAWLLRVGGLFRKAHHERELADELEIHVQLHIDDNLRAGMTPVEARRQALIKLGGVEQTKEIYRDRRGIPLIEGLLKDFRYGLRMLAKRPGFTADRRAHSRSRHWRHYSDLQCGLWRCDRSIPLSRHSPYGDVGSALAGIQRNGRGVFVASRMAGLSAKQPRV
jgi:hypothetical protein